MMLGRKTRAAYISILRITSGTIYGIKREGKTLYRWLHIVSLVVHCTAGSTVVIADRRLLCHRAEITEEYTSPFWHIHDKNQSYSLYHFKDFCGIYILFGIAQAVYQI